MLRPTLVLLCLAMPALAEESPWLGDWAADPDWCAQAGRTGEVPEAPIRITDSEFLGYENRCRITEADPLQILPGAELVLDCTAEGETFADARLLVIDAADSMLMLVPGAEPLRLSRCPKGTAAD
ncbi:hypothetical protein [Cereibacter sediminicola]|uniref:hypothetical protein n=1 Tax=Cereibacter sediminicola TaxID=2584941 RepID=UPI00119F89CB|nr:hypothetical protein [Cereibacter sediminicola]